MTNTRPVRRARPPERRLPFGAPVRAWTQAEWALLPLRCFLGGTFLFAGLQKLSNPNFLNSQSASSIQAQLIAATRVSPIKFLLTHLVQFAKPIGLLIAVAEIAIGVGALLGLWTRVAAVGGAVLALSLFLTVSFHASPFYTGADIVFFFAWLPFIVAGSGSRLSVDSWIAVRAAKTERAPSPTLVSIPFAQVQRLCGHYTKGRCAAREGLACDAAVCPVLLGDRAPRATRGHLDPVDRRALVLGSAAALTIGGAAALLGGATAAIGRVLGRAPAPTAPSQLGGTTTTNPNGGTTPTTVPTAAGTLLGPAKDVPVGNAATFTIPVTGDPGIIVQPAAGSFLAYDAVCPHAGCTVGYYASNHVFACPCHGSTFALDSGAVLGGPSPRGLARLTVVEESDGNLYLK
ncbi:MAG: Rieske 2Fe-2S domain-containing protein [Acidimicrobiales bacterium]